MAIPRHGISNKFNAARLGAPMAKRPAPSSSPKGGGGYKQPTV